MTEAVFLIKVSALVGVLDVRLRAIKQSPRAFCWVGSISEAENESRAVLFGLNKKRHRAGTEGPRVPRPSSLATVQEALQYL